MRLRVFFFSSRRRHTRSLCDWSSDVCSSDLAWIRADHHEHGGGWQFLDAAVAAVNEAFGLGGGGAGDGRDFGRSGKRRVGEECRSRGVPYHLKKKKKSQEEFTRMVMQVRTDI